MFAKDPKTGRIINPRAIGCDPPPPPPYAHPLMADWEAWQLAAQMNLNSTKTRLYVVNKFAEESGVSPLSACPTDLARFLAGHPEWAPGTRVNYFKHLRAWFRWLTVTGHRADNPMVSLPVPRNPVYEPRPVSDAELVRLVAWPGLHSSTRAMILLAALAGLRTHEIAKVRGEDIDLDRRLLWVVGKGNVGRSVPLHDTLVDLAGRMPRRGWWFPSPIDATKPVHRTSPSLVIGQAMTRAGITGGAHRLRHWYGTALLESGADLLTVQKLMRHADIGTTQVYLRVPDDRRHEAVARLDLFSPLRRGVTGR